MIWDMLDAFWGKPNIFVGHWLLKTSSGIHVEMDRADNRSIVLTVLISASSTFSRVWHNSWYNGGNWFLIIFHFLSLIKGI